MFLSFSLKSIFKKYPLIRIKEKSEQFCHIPP